jgi:hypothetical protein
VPDAEAGPDGAGEAGAMPASADVGELFGSGVAAPTGWADEPPHPVRPASTVTARAMTADLAKPGTQDITAHCTRRYRPNGDRQGIGEPFLAGVHFVLKRGSRFIRVVLLCVVIALVVKLAYDQFA